MNNTQTDNKNEVFIVIDTDIVQQIAEANLDRHLTKEELSRFEDVLVSQGISEIDDFIYNRIKMVVDDEEDSSDESTASTTEPVSGF